MHNIKWCLFLKTYLVLIVELNMMFEAYTINPYFLMILFIGTLTEYFNGINDIVHYKQNEEKRILFYFLHG